MNQQRSHPTPPGLEHCSAEDIRAEIEEQWAEICRLEDIAMTMERGEGFDENGIPARAKFRGVTA